MRALHGTARAFCIGHRSPESLTIFEGRCANTGVRGGQHCAASAWSQRQSRRCTEPPQSNWIYALSHVIRRQLLIVARGAGRSANSGESSATDDHDDSATIGEKSRNWAQEHSEGVQQNVEDAKENIADLQQSVEEAQDEARGVIAAPVERIADSLDENEGEGQDNDITSAVKGDFGSYNFQEAQLRVIASMVTGIRGCAVASGAVAVVEVLTTIGKAIHGGNAKDAVLIVGGVHVNNVAVILDYGLTSVLLFMAAKSFKHVLSEDNHQLKFVMQGLLQLAFVFMQASSVTASMAIIQLLQAARRWPPLVTWITGLTAGAAAVRAVALARILSKYTPGGGKALAVLLAMQGGQAKQIQRRMSRVDRLALAVVGGLVLPLTVAGEQQKFPDSEEEEPAGTKEARARGDLPRVDLEEETAVVSPEYEFQPQENQLLELVMNSMRVAATALAFKAFSTACLAAATLVQEKGWLSTGWDCWNFGMHMTDQVLRAGLLFTAAGFFYRAITTKGHDVENLVTALGSQGLGRLFKQTKKIMQGVLTGLFVGWAMSGYKIATAAGYL